MKDNTDFKYSLKICKNKTGVKMFIICNHCNTANPINRKRCVRCFRKLKTTR